MRWAITSVIVVSPRRRLCCEILRAVLAARWPLFGSVDRLSGPVCAATGKAVPLLGSLCLYPYPGDVVNGNAVFAEAQRL